MVRESEVTFDFITASSVCERQAFFFVHDEISKHAHLRGRVGSFGRAGTHVLRGLSLDAEVHGSNLTCNDFLHVFPLSLPFAT